MVFMIPPVPAFVTVPNILPIAVNGAIKVAPILFKELKTPLIPPNILVRKPPSPPATLNTSITASIISPIKDPVAVLALNHLNGEAILVKIEPVNVFRESIAVSTAVPIVLNILVSPTKKFLILVKSWPTLPSAPNDLIISSINFGVKASTAFLNLEPIVPSVLNAATMSSMNWGFKKFTAFLNSIPILPSAPNALNMSSMNWGLRVSIAVLNNLPILPSEPKALNMSVMNFGVIASIAFLNLVYNLGIVYLKNFPF